MSDDTGGNPGRGRASGELGSALRELRAATGSSLRQLERALLVSDSSLSRYLRGEQLPPWQVVEALCREARRDPAAVRPLWEAARRARDGVDDAPPAAGSGPTPGPAPAPGDPAGRGTPALLPRDVADFTGRVGEAERLSGLLTGREDGPHVVAVSGRGGVGKSTLALHVAHRVAGGFPDGQLYVDLGASQARPADPGEVLGRFLRALGVPKDDVPDSAEERADRYRSLLAQRRLLLLLDDAAGETQLQPLLPGTGASAVLVTSRTPLTGIPGAHRLDLEVLSPGEGRALLGAVAGAGRVTAEPEAASALVGLCGGLPLALRITGARLAARPHWRLADLAARLRDERRRLDVLQHRDLAVRAGFALAREGLPPAARLLFGRLGLLEAPDVAPWVAAALLDAPEDEAEEALDALVDARLLDVAGRDAAGQTRLRFHSLVRVHAAECAEEEPAEERHAALMRAFAGWLALVDAACVARFGGTYNQVPGDAPRRDPGREAVAATAAATWVEAELGALAATVHQAAGLGVDELCWQLAARTSSLLEVTLHSHRGEELVERALQVTREAGNLRGQAALLRSIYAHHVSRSDSVAALRAALASLRIWEQLEDRAGIGYAMRQVATALRHIGRLAEARSYAERSVALLQESGDEVETAQALITFGCVLFDEERPEEALEALRKALALARAARNPQMEGQSAFWASLCHIALGQLADAERAVGEVDRVVRAIRDPVGQLYVTYVRGLLLLERGRHADAARVLGEALATARERRDLLTEARVLYELGRLHMRNGETAEARECLLGVRRIGERFGWEQVAARARVLLAELPHGGNSPVLTS